MQFLLEYLVDLLIVMWSCCSAKSLCVRCTLNYTDDPLPPSLFSPPVRSVLGCMVCLTLISFLRVVSSWLGPLVSTFAILLTMAQFHFLFYASRTLPNTFALALGACRPALFSSVEISITHAVQCIPTYLVVNQSKVK